MQTILGAGGTIGLDLAEVLTHYTDKVRLVARNPQFVVGNEDLFRADLLNKKDLLKALENSDVAYLVAGLKYRTQVWEEQWPKIIENTIEACKQHGTKLVFFDNVYMYGRVEGKMTEETPYNPISRKGEVRAKIAQKIMESASKGEINALIARSADFYGPKAKNTFTYMMVFTKLMKGKKASWLINDDPIHSHTFTPDAAKGTALLGNTDDAYGHVWHLPTDPEPINGKQFMELASEAFGVGINYNIMKKWMLKLVGLFNSNITEIMELIYQNEYDYYFDSTKFNKRFFEPTSYRKGLKITAKELLDSNL
jgi:nucleoside-diphosphate-sugar epimerase